MLRVAEGGQVTRELIRRAMIAEGITTVEWRSMAVEARWILEHDVDGIGIR